MATTLMPTRQSDLSPFELLITCNPPILQSLLAQASTEAIFRLYQTSSFLRDFFSKSPTSWRYISWRLSQPAAVTALTANNGGAAPPRQSSNYALDQILLNVINPFSTRLVSLELDNTAVSGATLTSTVLVLRRDTLQHVSVRGCKNVSLKYHINPWLQMHALARESQTANGPPGFETLALKSLYTYRCRHHRRRPYLPSSLARKESDSEPTHELVLTCHKLGIWTDTAWCTTPGARCYRRRGYVKMRMPQDPREVWVVYDRLWRSRNWLGPIDQSRTPSDAGPRRKRDCRSWEFDEEGINGEPIGLRNEGKATPAHLRETHKQFVENITCHNCSAEILERCEQCSVMMHCVGCRKTLCASCAFDRPYLRNKHASEEERNRFWWAPGCAVSPCSMQDQDLPANGVIIGSQTQTANVLPNIKFRWCCTEPVFSGGGGITFGGSNTRETDRIRAAPLPSGQGWEDPEFSPDRSDLGKLTGSSHSRSHAALAHGPGGRWSSMDNFFQTVETLSPPGYPPISVPRVLCDECYSSEHWKLKCEACSTALCLKHDIGDRMKARICGYRDLVAEKQEYRSRQKALKLLATLMRHRKERLGAAKPVQDQDETSSKMTGLVNGVDRLFLHAGASTTAQECEPGPSSHNVLSAHAAELEVGQAAESLRAPLAELDLPLRSRSPASDTTGPQSRSTSPTPSAQSTSATESGALPYETDSELPSMPRWQGCQAFFCPATRPPSDHRRRCTAVMKQCLECKVQVCGTCVNAEGPPCPCKGCRGTVQPDEPTSSAGPAMSAYVNAAPADAAPFYCPNCRWERMLTGRCKRKTEEFLRAQSQTLRKMKKRKDKRRKPVYDRQGESNPRSAAEDAIDGLVEFFTSLNVQFSETGHSEEVDAMLALPEVDPNSATNMNDIQELEDMGALARDLIRRIQRLRDQFRPGSLAALALPDIRLEGDLEASAAVVRPAHPELSIPFQPAPGHAGGQLEVMHENELMLDQPEMDDDDDDDEHLLDGRDSSSE